MDLMKEVLGEKYPEALTAVDNLAITYRSQGYVGGCFGGLGKAERRSHSGRWRGEMLVSFLTAAVAAMSCGWDELPPSPPVVEEKLPAAAAKASGAISAMPTRLVYWGKAWTFFGFASVAKGLSPALGARRVRRRVAVGSGGDILDPGVVG